MKEICDEIYKYNKMCDNMCNEYEKCNECNIYKFNNEYNTEIDNNCEAIFIAIHLLGYNVNTAEYIKKQYSDMKSKICVNYKCKYCPINDIKRKNKHYLFRFEVYIGMSLLREV